jgi:hypothetical protein
MTDPALLRRQLSDTIGMLRPVLNDAWATLSPHQQTQAYKSIMAQKLLKLAADGERRSCANSLY